MKNIVNAYLLIAFFSINCNEHQNTIDSDNKANSKTIDSNTAMITSRGELVRGKLIEHAGIKFNLSYKDNKIIEVSTSDSGFVTVEGASVGMEITNLTRDLKDKIKKIELYNNSDSFYKLSSGWIANVNFDIQGKGRISYFFTRDQAAYSYLLISEK